MKMMLQIWRWSPLVCFFCKSFFISFHILTPVLPFLCLKLFGKFPNLKRYSFFFFFAHGFGEVSICVATETVWVLFLIPKLVCLVQACPRSSRSYFSILPLSLNLWYRGLKKMDIWWVSSVATIHKLLSFDLGTFINRRGHVPYYHSLFG